MMPSPSGRQSRIAEDSGTRRGRAVTAYPSRMPEAVGEEDGEVSSPPPPERPRPRRGRRRRALSVLGVLVVVVAVWTIVAGLVAAHRLRAVRDDVSRLTKQSG